MDCVKPGLIRSELCNRRRMPGETLRALANDIESLSRRAYAHMPPAVQSELARDQFLQALSPTELRMQTLLAQPADFARGLGDGHREGAGVGWSNRRSSCSSADGEIGEGEE